MIHSGVVGSTASNRSAAGVMSGLCTSFTTIGLPGELRSHRCPEGEDGLAVDDVHEAGAAEVPVGDGGHGREELIDVPGRVFRDAVGAGGEGGGGGGEGDVEGGDGGPVGGIDERARWRS